MNNVSLVFGGALLIMIIMSGMILQLGGAKRYHRSHETRLLYFAAVILTALGLIFVIGMAMSYWDAASTNHVEGSGAKIFNQCLQVIPPIVTLVLGYFFGRQEATRSVSNDLGAVGTIVQKAPPDIPSLAKGDPAPSGDPSEPT